MQNLGLQIDSTLDWSTDISSMVSRGYSKLSFLRRNLKGCPSKLRGTTYFSLVRPSLEYCCSVWHPHQNFNSDKIEKIQRKAARFVSNKYGRTDSVSAMLHDLGWHSLNDRRLDQRLILFYKIISGLTLLKQKTFWQRETAEPEPKMGSRNSDTSRHI